MCDVGRVSEVIEWQALKAEASTLRVHPPVVEATEYGGVLRSEDLVSRGAGFWMTALWPSSVKNHGITPPTQFGWLSPSAASSRTRP